MNEEQELVAVTPDQIGESLRVVNECLIALGKRLESIEQYVSELPTPAKTFYKPAGYNDYLNLKENFDELYRRVGEIEKNAL